MYIQNVTSDIRSIKGNIVSILGAPSSDYFSITEIILTIKSTESRLCVFPFDIYKSNKKYKHQNYN